MFPLDYSLQFVVFLSLLLCLRFFPVSSLSAGSVSETAGICDCVENQHHMLAPKTQTHSENQFGFLLSFA